MSLRRVYARPKGRSNENTYFQHFARPKSIVRQSNFTQNRPTRHPKCLIINALQAVSSKKRGPAPFPPTILQVQPSFPLLPPHLLLPLPHYLFTSLLRYLDFLDPHIRPQNLRHHNRPILLLIILHHRDPRPPPRHPRPIQRVHKIALPAALRLKPYPRPPRLKRLAVRA